MLSDEADIIFRDKVATSFEYLEVTKERAVLAVGMLITTHGGL